MINPKTLCKLLGRRPDPAVPQPRPGLPPLAPRRGPRLFGQSAPPALPPPAPSALPARSARASSTGETEGLPGLTVSAPALAALRWSARRSPDECCFWGVLEPSSAGLLLAEAVLARHQGSPAYSVPDMEWYGDLLAERHALDGLQPWQLACWIHTHPAGLDRPSGVDRATFLSRFGRQRLAVMLIMTHDLLFCGELSACLPALDGLPPARLASPLRLAFEDPLAEAAPEQAACLARQHAERVTPLAGGGWGDEAGPEQPWWLELRDAEEDEDEAAEEDGGGPWLPECADEPDWNWFGRPGRRQSGRSREVSRRELEAYALGFLTADAHGRPAFDPALLELELIAAGLGNPEMRVREAAGLRQRLRGLDPQQIMASEEEA